jgi:small subunit ribosomal protein S20
MATDRLKKKIGVGRHASSIKRARQTITRNARNKSQLSKMRTAVKAVRVEGTEEALKKAIPIIMKTAQKGAIHRNQADRLAGRLQKHVNAQK